MRTLKALDKSGELIGVITTGEREILRNDEPCTATGLTYEELRYYEKAADSVYDLPIFDGEYITAHYNVFTARVPAVKT